MTKTILFTHDQCDDGFACSWVLSKARHQVETVFLSYGKEVDNMRQLIPAMCRGKEVIVADFSFDPELLVEMAKVASSFLMVDHHISALHRVRSYINRGGSDSIIELRHRKEFFAPHVFEILDASEEAFIYFDTTRCGSRLLWDKLFPLTEPPPLLKYVNLNSAFCLDESLHVPEIVAYLRSFSQEHSRWDAINEVLTDNPEAAISQGCAIQRSRMQDVDSLLTWMEPSQITLVGVPGLAINAPRTLQVALSTRLAMESNTFGAVWVHDRDRVFVNLRSADPQLWSAAAIAEAYDGGGHAAAAGFSVSTKDWLQILNLR